MKKFIAVAIRTTVLLPTNPAHEDPLDELSETKAGHATSSLPTSRG